MSHEGRAAASLAAQLNVAGLGAAVRVVQRAQERKVEADDTGDVLAVMRAGVEWTAALEQAETAFADGARVSRAALAFAMEDTGAGRVETEHFTAYTTAGKRGVVINDPAAIPPELMRQAPPAPDKSAIAKLLRDGRTVPGAALDNGGAPSLTIRSKHT